MNIELLLRQYLYQHKNVTYPGIGKLVFVPNAQLPESTEKGEPFPLQDLVFTYNLHEDIDNNFVAFVSSQTGKIKPLAYADVESYFMLSKQFINIGKSFEVEGIGSVEKQDNGTFAFTPGYFLPVSEASAAPHKPLKIREAQPVVPKTETKRKAPAVNTKLVFLVVGILGFALIAWAVYYFVIAKKTPETNAGTVAPIVADTSATSVQKPDSNLVVAAPSGFKAIVDQKYTRAFAEARAAKLRTFGHNAQVDSAGPGEFRIFIPVKDTTYTVDSLKLLKISGKRPKFVPM